MNEINNRITISCGKVNGNMYFDFIARIFKMD